MGKGEGGWGGGGGKGVGDEQGLSDIVPRKRFEFVKAFAVAFVII